MSFIEDLTGQRFGLNGMLLVLKQEGAKQNGTRSVSTWLVQCNCGREVILTRHQLRHNHSCGCLRSISVEWRGNSRDTSWRLDELEGAWRSSFQNFKGRCKVKKNGERQAFTLTYDQWRYLASQDCLYCGNPPINSLTYRAGKSANKKLAFYQGLDRLDNTKGYELDNVIPCCKFCNWARNQQSLGEWFNHIKKLFVRLPLLQELVF